MFGPKEITGIPQSIFDGLFEQMQDIYAREQANTVESYIRLAGFPIRLVQVSKLRTQFFSAFKGFTVQPSDIVQPALTIFLFSGPSVFFNQFKAFPQNGCFKSPDKNYEIQWRSEKLMQCIHFPSNVIVAWLPNEEELENYFYAKPLLVTISAWMAENSIYLAHGGVVSKNGQGYFLAGKGGIGKSTMCASLLNRQGYQCLGDDRVGIEEQEENKWVAHAIFPSIQINQKDEVKFSSIKEWRRSKELNDKSLLILNELGSQLVPPSVPISCIIFPGINDVKGTPVRKLSKNEAFIRMTPSCLEIPSTKWRESLECYGRMIAAMPCYEVKYQLGECLVELINGYEKSKNSSY